MEALMFLVNNLGGTNHSHSGSSSEGSGSDSSGRHHSGLGSASDGPGAAIKEIDFKALREAFRSLDTENLGMLSMAEVKQAFKDASIPAEDVDRIFRSLDTNGDGLINYSEFLAATVDRKKALSM
jgi:hypothetical protein